MDKVSSHFEQDFLLGGALSVVEVLEVLESVLEVIYNRVLWPDWRVPAEVHVTSDRQS